MEVTQVRSVFNGRQVQPKRSDKRMPPEYKKLHFGDADLQHSDPWGEQEQAHRDLVAAVIHQAVDDIKTGTKEWPREGATLNAIRDSARLWLQSTSKRVFGFEWCCLAIDRNPEVMRAAIFERKS